MAKRAKKPRQSAKAFQFTLLDELSADPVRPMAPARLALHLKGVCEALGELEQSGSPSLAAWRTMSDPINVLSSLAELGYVADEGGEIQAAKNAMGAAGARHLETHSLQLTDSEAHTLRTMLADYVEIVSAVSERQLVRAGRHAERRTLAILRGKVAPGDKVMAL